MKILFIYPNTLKANRIPVGISYLSACLKKEGHKVFLYDTTFIKISGKNFEQISTESDDDVRAKTLQVNKTPLDDLMSIPDEPVDINVDFTDYLNKIRPDLVAMSCHQNTYPLGIEILKMAKSNGYKTIVGGVKVTTAFDEVFQEDSVDMICIGEGENSLVELCNKLDNNEDITNISNLWIKQNGNIFKNEVGHPTNLDSLPSQDWSIFDERHLIRPMGGKIYKMGFFELSRGCPFKCTYCINDKLISMYKNKNQFLRFYGLEKIITEMKNFKHQYNLNYITFNDDLFLGMKIGRLEKLCKMYASEINLPFFMETRPETVKYEKIKLLADAGLERMAMGIESGSDYIRKNVLNRKITNERMIESFKIVKNFGINISTNNMLGMPLEGREHVFETIEINRRIKANSSTIKFVYPYQGTEIYDFCKEKGYIDETKLVSGYQMGSILKLPQISNEELEGLHKTFQLYCNLSRIFFPLIKLSEKENIIGKTIFKILGKLLKMFKNKM